METPTVLKVQEKKSLLVKPHTCNRLSACPSEPAVRNPGRAAHLPTEEACRTAGCSGVPGSFLDLICPEWEMGPTPCRVVGQSSQGFGVS